MPAPFNNLRSKNDRAIVAYLISLLNPIIGDKTNILPRNYRGDKTYPNTTVQSMYSKPYPYFTGTRRITIHIAIRGTATIATPQTTDATPRLAFDARVAATYDALLQNADYQTLRATATAINAAGRALAISDPVNNADMADYTCQEWIESGEGEGEMTETDIAEACAFNEVLMFDCVACPSNVD